MGGPALVPQPRSARLFCRLWQDPRIRDRLFEQLPREDLGKVRLASAALCTLLTRRLFMRITVSFTASTFTKPSRTQALARIGHHVEHLTFHFAHSDATFLPPLVHPADGHEVSFLYKPHTSMASIAARPKFANSELGGLLTQQYPPLFHAATNVPSFINALRHLVNMRHLTIRCPGQDPRERYRRDVVDYALISLRIAIERAPLIKLNRLTLTSLHPAAFNYLRHVPGFGSVPSASKRWRQIRKLYVSVEAWDFYGGSSPGMDHLKIIDDYIRSFSPNLEKMSFAWLGARGPCPLALAADPLFSPPSTAKKLFNEVTSPMSPLPACPPRKSMHMPRLKGLQVRNANMNVAQLSDLVAAHSRTVRQFEFENVALADGGSWDEALAPLTSRASGKWARTAPTIRTTMAAPKPAPPLVSSPPPAPVSTWDDLDENDERTDGPSAAVRAVSLELLNVDLDLDRIIMEEEEEEEDEGYYDNDNGLRGGDEEIYFDEGGDEVLFCHDDEQPVDQARYEHYEDEEDDYYDEEDGGVKMGDHDHEYSQGSSDSQQSDAATISTTVSYSATLTRKHTHKRHHRKHARPSNDDRRGRSGTKEKDNDKDRRLRHHRSRSHGAVPSKSRSQRSVSHRRHGSAGDEPSKRSRDFLPIALPSIISAPLALLPSLSLKPAPLMLQRKPSTRAATPLSNPNKAALASLSRVASPSPPPSLSHSVDSLNSLVHSPGGGACATHPALRFEHLPPPHTPPPRPPPPTHPYQHPNYPVMLRPTVYTPPSSGLGSPPPPPLIASPGRFAPDSGISAVRRNMEQEETYRLLAEDADLRAGALKRAREAVLAKLSQEFRRRNNTNEAPGVGGGGGVRASGHINNNGCATSFTHGSRFRDALFAKSAVSVIPDGPRIESQSALVPLMLSR